MAKTAVLVDGGFYRKRAQKLWGKKSAKERAEELNRYVFRHILECGIGELFGRDESKHTDGKGEKLA